MNIKAIIPILNPPKFLLHDTIPLLQRQTVELSLLLLNSGHELLNLEQIEETQIPKSQFNHANTRNLALNYEADFYLFMTQDAMPYDETLVEKLCLIFENPEIVVAYARQIPYKNTDVIEVFARSTNYPAVPKVKSKDDLSTMGIKTFFNSDSCAMYRASYFKEVGGFKQGLNTNEDMEFAARAIMNGKKVAYVANAKVYHSHNFTCKDIWKRYRAIGKFFKGNQWILDVVSQYTKVQSTGLKQAFNELKYLLKKSPCDIPRSCLYSLIKYIAFKSAS